MKTKDLISPYYMYGNHGNVWSNNAHIAESGSFSGRTLCGTPMLATNWARIESLEDCNCEKCVKIYNEKIAKNNEDIKEVLVLRKTFETRKNNLLKQMYKPPYEVSISKEAMVERLEIQIKTLDLVLGKDKEIKPREKTLLEKKIDYLKYLISK